MEPLSALQAAAAVTQFVGYGYKVLSKSNELYKSADGSLKDNAFIELVIKDLKNLLDRITAASTPASTAFVHFRDESIKLADELLQALEKLKVKGDVTKLKSLRKALKSVHSKEKIKGWVEKLNMLRDEFNTHIAIEILENILLIDVPLSDGFQRIEQGQQAMLRDLIFALQNADPKDFFEEVTQKQTNTIINYVTNEHKETRSLISVSHTETLGRMGTLHETSLHEIDVSARRLQDHVLDQHDQTRTSNLSEHVTTRTLLSSNHEVALQSDRTEHDLTRTEVIDFINALVVDARDSVIENHQRAVKYLTSELTRARLDNSSVVQREHVQTRQLIGEVRKGAGNALPADAYALPLHLAHTDLVISMGRHTGAITDGTPISHRESLQRNKPELSSSHSGPKFSSLSVDEDEDEDEDDDCEDDEDEDDEDEDENEDDSCSSHNGPEKIWTDRYKVLHGPIRDVTCICGQRGPTKQRMHEISLIRYTDRHQTLGSTHRDTIVARLHLAVGYLCLRDATSAADALHYVISECKMQLPKLEEELWFAWVIRAIFLPNRHPSSEPSLAALKTDVPANGTRQRQLQCAGLIARRHAAGNAIHDDNSKYLCYHQRCIKIYRSQSDLERHIKRSHPNGLRQCLMCGETFAQQDHMKRHVKAWHIVPYNGKHALRGAVSIA